MAANPVKRRILREMVEHPLAAGPGHEYEVTASGREALLVGFVIERWLQNSPQGPLPFESVEAAMAVTALSEAWSTTVMHALSREPLSFERLHQTVACLSRRALRRQLTAMDRIGQIETQLGGDGKIVFSATDWLRAGIAPLIASARLERRDPQEGMAPIDALDVEAGFRCSLAGVKVPLQLSGTCWLGINLEDDESGCLTGVTAEVGDGRVIVSAAGLDKRADAWAAGSASDWLDTVIDPNVDRVRTGGDRWLTRALVDALHDALFGVPVA